MSYKIYMGVLGVILALVVLEYSTAVKENQKETRTPDRSLLKTILGDRNKRELRELCDQSSLGCILQDLTENKKRTKRKKKRKNRKKEKKNKRKIEKQKEEPPIVATCPHLDPPTDDEEDLEEEDENEQCPQVQQKTNDY